ncbi:ABC transporter ATP-binding protein [Ectothiorhodospiraceae bacterium WFHF3C12]|nr:ABC transporter ATP-binding protein [Ectothiorhodospiraceae bacterium WFHF3C12]
MLSVEDIHTFYGESHALQGVSLEIGEGEVVCLLGRNGAGKSTTLKSIVGLTPPARGRVRFEQREIQRMATYRISRLGIALVPEDRRIFAGLTVKENLEVADQAGRGAGKRWTIEGVLEAYPMLAELRDQDGATLSGGQQQMLAIVRALMTEPRLLLMDEPNEGLAPVIVQQIGELLDELAQTTTILFSDQSVPFALKHATRAYILEKGQVAWSGSTREMRDDPSIQERYLSVA